MKLLIILWLISTPHSTEGLLQLRESYYRAIQNEKAANIFFQELQRANDTTEPLLMGYLGIAYMIKAKFVHNPYTKFRNFVEGKNLLNKAIQADKRNIELRFLRFCAQSNAPIFLSYRGELHTDKQIILEAWTTLPDADLKRRIKEYMLLSEHCRNDEKTIFFHE